MKITIQLEKALVVVESTEEEPDDHTLTISMPDGSYATTEHKDTKALAMFLFSMLTARAWRRPQLMEVIAKNCELPDVRPERFSCR